VQIDASEVSYLCEQASRYFEKPIVPADVVWSYSGVRPLLEDGSGNAAAVTRDYFLELDTQQAPMLTVWGGKLTAFRKLAEEVADMVVGPLGCAQGAWTARASLPGGDLSAWIGPAQRPDTDFERFVQALALAPSKAAAHRCCAAWPVATGPVSIWCWDGALGAEVAPGLFEGRAALPAATGMGAHGRRRAVAPHQAGPALRRGRARGRPGLVPAHWADAARVVGASFGGAWS
jgi:glycerol-3-phosphate dehydrogenase